MHLSTIDVIQGDSERKVNIFGVDSTDHCEKKLIYTGCPRRNVPDFRRVFLMLKYNDITQNTYVQI